MNSTHSWIGAGFEWALQTSFHASILILLFFLVQAVLGKQLGARLGYWLGLLVLIRLLLPAVPSSSWSLASFLSSTTSRAEASISAASSVWAVEIPPAEETFAFILEDPFLEEAITPGISYYQAGGWIWICGAFFLLMIALWRYCRWSRLLGAGRPVADQATLSLVEETKQMLGVRRGITVVATEQLRSPALFGLWRMRLSLPLSMIGQFNREELKLILLHELAHLRRHDLALQWFMMAAQFLHWFNPLVWIAMHRLRADQEVLCDAAVLRLLKPEGRIEYGKVLLKVLDRVPVENRMFSSAVQVLSSKHEIKRRIMMIKNYKKESWMLPAITGLAVILVGALTLTGAANPQVKEELPDRGLLGKYSEFTGAGKGGPEADYSGGAEELLPSTPLNPDALEILLRGWETANRNVQRQQKVLDELRRKLPIAAAIAEGGTMPDHDQQHLTSLQRERTMAEVESIQYKALMERLGSLSFNELPQVLLGLMPDQLLSELLSAKLQAELAVSELEVGEEHPQVRLLRRKLNEIDSQISNRINGLMLGLKTRLDVLQERSEIAARKIEQTREVHALQAAQFRPYFDARQQLQQLERIRETIMLRILQEQVDAQLPPQ